VEKPKDYDEAWIISNSSLDGTTTEDEFVTEVAKFHESGGGLFIWGDNAPWTAHANPALKKTFRDRARREQARGQNHPSGRPYQARFL